MNLTIEDIRQLPEGQTFDCKSIQVSAKALAIPIVAMANADGGILAIGISDTNRRIEGIDQETKHLNDLLCVPMDLCVPSISVTFSYLPCTDEHGNANRILLIHVPASSRLHTTQNDECYMRVGDKSKKLNFEERLQLMSDKGERNFEDEPLTDATIEDINMDAVADFVRTIGYSKSPMEYLRENNNFITTKDGKERVSKACILLFGKYPQRFFQRARTRFIRYNGTEEKFGREMNVIKDVTFEGTILEQVRRTIDYLETQVREYSFLGEHGQFVTKRNYSKFAIQELVVNSVCHRDYSIAGTEIQIKMFDNRIVFETPGRLPGLVRPENIRHTHFSRNPKIALFLKAYKFVKEFGEGIDRICTELEQTGTPLLTFNPNYFILQTTLYEEEIITPESTAKENETHVSEQTGHETGHEMRHETGHEIRPEIRPEIKHIERVIREIGDKTLSRSAIMSKLGLKGRGNFLANYLYPAISAGYVAMQYPESEKRKDQAYYLTKKGKDVFDDLLRNRIPIELWLQ